jgi:hypothetical protein
MVEIGKETGALVVYTAAELEGREIEIRPHDGTWSGLHTGVRARHVGPRVLHAGVFGSLPVGLYDFRLRAGSGAEAETAETEEGAAVRTVAVPGGGVVETRFWRSDEPSSTDEPSSPEKQPR